MRLRPFRKRRPAAPENEADAAPQPAKAGRRGPLIRVLAELRPVRRWIILSNVLILLSSAAGALSLLAALPILQAVFAPGKAGEKAPETAFLSQPPPADEAAAATAAQSDPSAEAMGFDVWKSRGKAWLREQVAADPQGTVYWVCGVFVAVALLTAALNFASDACIVRVQTHFQRRMTRRLYLHCLHHDLLFFQFRGTGTLLSHVYNDVLRMSDAVKLTYGVRVRNPVVLLCLTAMLFATHAGLTLILLATVPLVVLPALMLGRRIKEISRQETGFDGGLLELLQERLSGIRLIKGFGAEEREADKFDEVCETVFERRHHRGMLMAMSKPATETMSTVGIALILLFGVYAVLQARWLDGETYAFFLLVLSRFYKPLKELAAVNVQMQRPLMSAEAVFRLLDAPPRIVDAPDAVGFPADWKTLEFADVTFRYGGKRKPNVLRGVSFSVERGQSTAVVGHNGSGKSTVAALTARFFDPTSGAILIDGIDLRRIRLASLRSAVGVCSQEAILFNLTVAENIAFGTAADRIDRQRLAWAARQAGADRFIESLPEGSDTPVGLRGCRLSGGQRQVLALARMFYRNFAVVVFDEPTSHLDAETERCMLEGIGRLAEDRTVILITHDLRHLEGFDRVVALEKGEVVRDEALKQDAPLPM